jgi:phage terminase small subunit
MAEKQLTPKQQRFVEEYLIDLNATQAATRAGYSAKTANEQGARLLANVSVRSAIEQAKAERSERTHITQDRVLQELARIAFFDLRKLYREDGSLKNPSEWDDDTAAALAGVEVVETKGNAEFGGEEGARHVPEFVKKAKTFDKNSALTLVMRHLGMLKDKTEITGKDGKDLPVTSGVLVVPGLAADSASWAAQGKA